MKKYTITPELCEMVVTCASLTHNKYQDRSVKDYWAAVSDLINKLLLIDETEHKLSQIPTNH